MLQALLTLGRRYIDHTHLLRDRSTRCGSLTSHLQSMSNSDLTTIPYSLRAAATAPCKATDSCSCQRRH